MKLKEAGFFTEIHGSSEYNISLIENITNKKYENKQKIINYLKSGHVLVTTGNVN